jgi:hypothetical protein
MHLKGNKSKEKGERRKEKVVFAAGGRPESYR